MPSMLHWYRIGAILRLGKKPQSLTTYEHAHRVYKQILQHYEPPPLEAAIREELDEFVARRTREGGVATDF